MPSSKPVAIITGATSGVGLECAKVFARAGYRLVLAGRRSTKGNLLVSELRENGWTASFKKTDVSNDAELAELFNFAEETYGQVNVVFNNAGIEGQYVPLESKVSMLATEAAVGLVML
eukprot:TRINITY_DN10841_c0_g1_i1.p1 TRINITY_DN10841_c0_g1~~TRINITY_DN10841_c0_g1_i1.p1  ORF type:complete len:118 (-),score=31.33 TRINITY_DN10841_c0_g1_i1:66-419(-)